MKYYFSLILWIFLIFPVKSQIINSYANITNIAGAVITINNVDEAFDTFENGEWVIVMQMQDNAIGANTANNATFGNLGGIMNAGKFEVRQIISHTESLGIPITVTLSSISNTYTIGANSSLQLISFPKFGAPNYTVSTPFTAKAWNGVTGGVLAFECPGTLTFSTGVNADFRGFRGGAVSINQYSGGTACNSTEYIRTFSHNFAGQKGEGIYKATNTDFQYARGHLLNGGGGGPERINTGGAGGGNFSAGGDGGLGYPGCSPAAGGIGGIGLNAHISANKVFMGGGGGGGQQNDSQGTSGGNGGGIVFIKANTVTTSCATSIIISANGQTAANGTNDGQGGGGAGGSILFQVQNWAVPATCPLTVRANAGNGGNANTGGTPHAGGGGGGQGTIIYSSTIPTTNINSTTNFGTGGINCTTCTSAQNGAGPNNIGVIGNSFGPLPIELLYFSAELLSNSRVYLDWQTATEINNDFFTIEKSSEGLLWFTLTTIKGAGNSENINNYQTIDYEPYDGFTYYRLKQTDFDGNSSMSDIQLVQTEKENDLRLIPNPTKNQVLLNGLNLDVNSISIINQFGQKLKLNCSKLNDNSIFIDLGTLSPGNYFVQYDNEVLKLMIE